MSIAYTTIVQGQGVVVQQTLQVSTFQGTETLAATISTGGTDAALLTLTPTWAAGQTTGSYGVVDVTLTSVQTAALEPGYYVLQVYLSGDTAALAWSLLSVVAAAGQDPSYDWLVQPAEVLGLVSDLVTVQNLPDLPRAISAASESIRRYCQRHFNRATYSKEFQPNYRGVVRLDEIPVNQVSRVATGRDNALNIAGPASAQIARVQFAYTGSYATGITNTGLILTSVSSGTTTTNTLLFATYPTLGTMAAAISGVSGWSASAGTYGSWPCTELVGGDSAQGALNASGAWLDVYSEDASLERLDPETGMIYLRPYGWSSALDTPAWGPGWQQFADVYSYPRTVKVTYDAGYDSVPAPVVMACVETVQSMFSRLSTDQIVQSERAGDYSYTLRDQVSFLPESVRHALAPYRIINA